MATGKVIGQIQVSEGNIEVIGVDGVVREPVYGGFVYEGEQVISADPGALFQIKYLALPEATAYNGAFRILADGSVVAGMDEMESVSSSQNLTDALNTVVAKEPVVELETAAAEDILDLETAAGEESADGSSAYIPTDIVAESSLQAFGRGANPDVDNLPGIAIGEEMTDDQNIAPVAVDDEITTLEDTLFTSTVDLDANDTDLDADALSVIAGTFATAQGGELILAADGYYTYKPADNFNGIDTVNYTVTDGSLTDVGTLTINVVPVNDVPTVTDDAGAITEDVDVISGELQTSGNIVVTDIEAGESEVIPQENVTNNDGYGVFSISADGYWTYTANNNDERIQALDEDSDPIIEEFTVVSKDGTATGTVTVTINGTDDGIQVSGDSGAVVEDITTFADGTLVATDVDTLDQPVTFTAQTDSSSDYGTFTVNDAGYWTYTLKENAAVDALDEDTPTITETYTVGVVNSDTGEDTTTTVTVTINGTDDGIQVSGDSGAVVEDITTFADGTLVATDVDTLDQPVTFTAQTDSSSDYGTFTVNDAGYWTYTLKDNAAVDALDEDTPTITETYTVGVVNSDTGEDTTTTVTVTINGTDDGIEVNGDSGAVVEDITTFADGTLVATDVDTLDQPVTFTAQTDSSSDYGTFTVNDAGYWTYTLKENAAVDALDEDTPTITETYTVGVVNSDTGEDTTTTVTVTINGTNDKPTIETNTIEAVEDIAYTITTSDFQGFSDVDDGDIMTDIRIDSLPANGTLYIDGVAATVGTIISAAELDTGNVYLTSLNNAADTSFTYSASDGTDWSDSQTMTVNITPVTDTVRTDALSVSMIVDPPVIDTSTLSMSDDTNEADNIFESNGLILTSPVGTLVQVNTQGNGLGIDSGYGSNDPRDIEGGYSEELNIQFPEGYSLNDLNIDVKHTSSDEMSIVLYDENGNPISSGVTFTNSDGIALSVTDDGNGVYTINGNDVLSNGGDTIVIYSSTAFESLDIIDANAVGSGGTDGFSIINIYGTAVDNPDSYTSTLNIDGLGLGDTDGSEEISTVTLSDFPAGSVITLPDGVTEVTADLDGNWVIDASDLGLSADPTALNDVSLDVTSPTYLSNSFVPTIDIVTTEIGESVPDAHTILGSQNDSIFIGGDGDDYIDGGDGSDIIDTGSGNDTIVYDSIDSSIDGGTGIDTLIVSDSDSLDLSNVSNINTVQLESLATVTGTGGLGITATDVMNATDAGSNELIIQSADGNGTDNSVTIDTSTFTDISSDADYNIFSDGTSTLMVDIDIPIDTV